MPDGDGKIKGSSDRTEEEPRLVVIFQHAFRIWVLEVVLLQIKIHLFLSPKEAKHPEEGLWTLPGHRHLCRPSQRGLAAAKKRLTLEPVIKPGGGTLAGQLSQTWDLCPGSTYAKTTLKGKNHLDV